MVPPRSCLPCRNAKARCDRVRPICARCSLRGISCSGLQAEVDIMFRDENIIARQNSERARRFPGANCGQPVTFEVSTALQERENLQLVGSPSSLKRKQLYPWLSARFIARIPTPLEGELETRAVDRFFVSWTLHSCNDGTRPGHLAHLRLLYTAAAPDSILCFAVRAMAFAALRHLSIDNASAGAKALRNYGSALNQLRIDMDAQEKISSDEVLAALLLIDNFESIYLARTEPLGPHSEAITHILHERGPEQFLGRSQFSFWRVTHHRLQAHQILNRSDPTEEQKEWLSNLDTDITPIQVTADVQQMSILASAARRLTMDTNLIEPTLSERVMQVQNLSQTITDFLASAQEWTATTTGTWKPEEAHSNQISQPTGIDDPLDLPIPLFASPRFLSYCNIWSAEKWTFHAAGQIVLRESLIDLIY